MKKWGQHRGALPTISQLIALEATARLGNFRMAAEEVSLTQGAIAQQIRGLEKELGVSLFDRVPRGLIPNQKCIEYINRLELALGIIEEATRQAQNQKSHDDSSVVLSTTPSFASRWLIPHLPSLSVLHPEIALMIDASADVRPFYGEGKIDMAIRWGSPPFLGMQAHFLSSGNLIPVCAPTLLGDREVLTPQALSSFPLISDSHYSWKVWLEVYGDASSKVTGPVFSQTSHSIRAAEQGMGIALVPELLVLEEIKAGSLVSAVDKAYQLETEEDFYIVTVESLEEGSATQKVVNWLLDEV